MEFLVDPESGAVRLDFKMNPRQKLLLALATEKVAADLGRTVSPEEVIRAVTESYFTRRNPEPAAEA